MSGFAWACEACSFVNEDAQAEYCAICYTFREASGDEYAEEEDDDGEEDDIPPPPPADSSRTPSPPLGGGDEEEEEEEEEVPGVRGKLPRAEAQRQRVEAALLQTRAAGGMPSVMDVKRAEAEGRLWVCERPDCRLQNHESGTRCSLCGSARPSRMGFKMIKGRSSKLVAGQRVLSKDAINRIRRERRARRQKKNRAGAGVGVVAAAAVAERDDATSP